MLKRIGLLTVLLMFIIGTNLCLAAPTDAEIVISFKQYISDNMNKVLATYNGEHFSVIYSDSYKDWFKTRDDIDSNYKIDIKKTDSLLYPYVGTLEVNKRIAFYQHRDSKESAANDTNINRYVTETYRFTIAYQDNQWVVTDSKINNNLIDKWYDWSKDIFASLKCSDDKYPKS